MDPLTFKKVRSPSRLDSDAIKITLYRDETKRVCGWFIGPVRIRPEGIDLPFLPRSERAQGSVAIVRAIETAEAHGLKVCIVDPDDLWLPAWNP